MLLKSENSYIIVLCYFLHTSSFGTHIINGKTKQKLNQKDTTNYVVKLEILKIRMYRSLILSCYVDALKKILQMRLSHLTP